MRVSHKVALFSSSIVVITFTVFSWLQYKSVKANLYTAAKLNVEQTSTIVSNEVSRWLNNKLELINIVAKSISDDFSAKNIQTEFNNPILKDKFLLVFGGLDTDGKPITNSKTWSSPGWDARARPWYDLAKNAKSAVLTPPYQSSSTKKMLISAVANLNDKSDFKGAFGGDISLEEIASAINQVTFNDTGYAFVINKNQLIISHPDAAFNGKHLGDLFATDSLIIGSEFQHLETGDTTSYVSFQPLNELDNKEWYLGIVLDESKVMAQATSFGISAIIGGVLSALLCSIALFFAVSRILLPLKKLNHSLIDISSGEGNLTTRLDTQDNDEFGAVSKNFNLFISQLQRIIVDVKDLSLQIRDDSQKTSRASDDSANGITAQLEELENLAVAMEKMNHDSQKVSSNALSSVELSQSADTDAADGASIMADTSRYINHLMQEMENVNLAVNELEQYSVDIQKVLTAITSIAEQTNLLALNAAIEAARAGESGRGFAVVADEVRTLAVRTQQSTDETSDIIKKLQSGVSDAVGKIDKSKDVATKTNEAAMKADVIFTKIRHSISDIKNLSVEISNAAKQQSEDCDDINSKTNKIRDISQEVYSQAQAQNTLCDTMVSSTDDQEQVLKKFKT